MVMPFEELNNIRLLFEANKKNLSGKIIVANKKELEDDLLDLLIDYYLLGVDDANRSLGTDVQPKMKKMRETIYEQYNGRNFADDLGKYAEVGDVAGMALVAETSAHRAFSVGQFETALSGKKAKTKTWQTMLDDKVRDQHSYLQGITIPIDAEFYTYTGAHAICPGKFNEADNDCNCRCWLNFQS